MMRISHHINLLQPKALTMMRVRYITSRGNFQPIIRCHNNRRSGSGGGIIASSIISSLDRPMIISTTERNTTTMSSSSKSKSTSSSSNRTTLVNTANILFAVAAMVSSFRSTTGIVTFADARTISTSSQRNNAGGDSGDNEAQVPTTSSSFPKAKEDLVNRKCYYYGCPIYPFDIVENPPNDKMHNEKHDDMSFRALSEIRSKTRSELMTEQQQQQQTSSTNEEKKEEEEEDWLSKLNLTGTYDMATITMTGYKGGSTASQINQDRAFASRFCLLIMWTIHLFGFLVSILLLFCFSLKLLFYPNIVGPYYISDKEQKNEEDDPSSQIPRRLLGVMGKLGSIDCRRIALK